LLFIRRCDITGKVFEIRYGKTLSEKPAEAFSFSNGVNIQIMRTFTKLREMMATHKDLAKKLAALEKKYGSSGFCVGSFSPFIDFLACPLRSLNEIFDPSKATSARSRKLGLRPQTVRARPCGTLP
jgi:hypothetical protein